MDEEEIIEKNLRSYAERMLLAPQRRYPFQIAILKSLMYYHQHSPNINATLLVSPRKTSRYLLFNDDKSVMWLGQ